MNDVINSNMRLLIKHYVEGHMSQDDYDLSIPFILKGQDYESTINQIKSNKVKN
jgi:hypothetical protein